jgi:hypothetical protein
MLMRWIRLRPRNRYIHLAYSFRLLYSELWLDVQTTIDSACYCRWFGESSSQNCMSKQKLEHVKGVCAETSVSAAFQCLQFFRFSSHSYYRVFWWLLTFHLQTLTDGRITHQRQKDCVSSQSLRLEVQGKLLEMVWWDIHRVMLSKQQSGANQYRRRQIIPWRAKLGVFRKILFPHLHILTVSLLRYDSQPTALSVVILLPVYPLFPWEH